jgi:hypothetical protein
VRRAAFRHHQAFFTRARNGALEGVFVIDSIGGAPPRVILCADSDENKYKDGQEAWDIQRKHPSAPKAENAAGNTGNVAVNK